MRRLDRRRTEALDDLLRDLYAFGGLEAFGQRLLAALPRVIPAEVVLYSELDPRARVNRLVVNDSAALDFRDSGTVFVQHMDDIPWRKHYRRGEGSAVKISDFMPMTRFRRLAVYNEFYRKAGFQYHITKGLPGPAGAITTINLGRDRRDFSEDDRLTLNLLRPHLNQAYRNAEAVSRLEAELARVRGALEVIDRGIVVLEVEGNGAWMTRRAEQLLERYFGRARRQGDPLPDPLRRWVMARRAWRGDGSVPDPMGALTIAERTGTLTVRFVRDRNQDLLLLDEHAAEVPAAPLQALGLSPREAEVLAWMAGGKTNGEIASILGASPRTIDKHVERIHAKLGVENRTAAAARALGFLASSAP